MKRPRSEYDVRDALVIILLIFSVLIIGSAIVGLYLFNRSSQAGDPSGDLTLLTMPYNVNLRSLPNPGDQNILPGTVGPFTRKTWTSTLKADVLTGQAVAIYVDGSATVAVRVALDANDVQALGDLSKLAASINWGKPIFQTVDNAGYFEATDPMSKKVRLIYVRRYWLFDETASSQAALDSFVAAFAF